MDVEVTVGVSEVGNRRFFRTYPPLKRLKTSTDLTCKRM